MKFHIWLSLLVLPAILLISSNNGLARAEDDVEDEGVDVEGEDLEAETSVTGDDETVEQTGPGASPDADTTILFTTPLASTSLDLPGGKLVEFLVGFTNKGKQDFMLETLDASFRYPMDFTFYIQNFSTLAYSRLVKPGHEATLAYSFIPSEGFAGRPFGLSINLNYRDASGGFFREAVYNETVQVIELEEGIDGETFFLYLFMAACMVLLLVGGQQFLVSMGKKRGHISRKPQVETGTNDNPNDVNYDWLPKDALKSLNGQPQQRSPKTPKTSPRQRKVKHSDD